MKKDLILITAYIPDVRREQMLRELVYGINRSNFDIMISSHSFIPEDIFNKADYVIYEKKNDIDFDYKNKFYFYFSNEFFSIKTTEAKRYNHFIPVIRHINFGLSSAKNLGYNKVHYFEYDSLIIDDYELLENSKLLEEYSAIYYQIPHLEYPNSPISFNLNNITPLWFDLNYKNFYEFLNKENSTKLVEEYEWNLLTNSGKILNKKSSDLDEKNIKVALNFDLEDNKWVVPVYDETIKSICIFNWVENKEDENSKVLAIINETNIIKLDRSFKGFWSIIPIGKLEEVKKITIIVNDLITRRYDFNEYDINEYIKYNFITKNK